MFRFGFIFEVVENEQAGSAVEIRAVGWIDLAEPRKDGPFELP